MNQIEKKKLGSKLLREIFFGQHPKMCDIFSLEFDRYTK